MTIGVNAFAGEGEGIIIRRNDTYNTETNTYIDIDNDRIPDITLCITYNSPNAKRSSYIDSLLQPGMTIKFDDDYLYMPGKRLGLNKITLDPNGLLEIDKLPISKLAGATPKKFPLAFQQQNQH
jgi:hypothetical protein